jgi:hypothetical protein
MVSIRVGGQGCCISHVAPVKWQAEKEENKLPKKKSTKKNTTPEKESVKFTLEPVDKKPDREGSNRTSPYDEPLDQFLESGHQLSTTGVKKNGEEEWDKKVQRIAARLNSRIQKRNLKAKVSTVNGEIFLERTEGVSS